METGRTLDLAVQALHRGGVVAFPTETYYGLAVDPFSDEALAKLFSLKRRRDNKPVLVLIDTPGQLGLLVEAVPPACVRLMEHFWPGPLTLVLPARQGLPRLLTGGTGTVGVRISPNPVAQELVRRFGGPLTATSANVSGLEPAVEAGEVVEQFGNGVDVLVDGGSTPGGLGSTVVGYQNGQLVLVRDGVVPFGAVLDSIEQNE